MRKLLIFYLVTVSFQVNSQSLQRKILYTLLKNEIIHYGEALLSVKNNSSNFCMVIEDTIKKSTYFVSNGKKIISQSSGYTLWIENLNIENNSYVIEYTNDSQDFLNINGVNYGPYEYITPMYCEITKEFGYMYKLGVKFYLKIGNKKYGPFTSNHQYGVYLADERKVFTSFNRNIEYTAVVSGSNILELNNKEILLNGKIIQSENQGSLSKLSFESMDNYSYITETGYSYNNTRTFYKIVNGVKSALPLAYDGYIFYSSRGNIYHSQVYYNNEKSWYLHSIYKNGNMLYTNIKNILAFDRQDLFLFQDKNNHVYLNNQEILNDSDAEINLYNVVFETKDKFARPYSLIEEGNTSPPK